MSVYLLMEAEHAKVNDAAGAFFEKKRINRWCLKGGSEYQFFQIFAGASPFFPNSGDYGCHADFWGNMFEMMSGYDLDKIMRGIKEGGHEGEIRIRGIEGRLCFFAGGAETPVAAFDESEYGPLVQFAREVGKEGKLAAWTKVQANGAGFMLPVRRPDIEYALLGEQAQLDEIVVPFPAPISIHPACDNMGFRNRRRRQAERVER